jgi:dienelactone hydrolase
MRWLPAGVAGLAALLAIGIGTASPAASGSWVGTYRLGGGDDLAVTLSGRRALVVLGAGHATLQTVPLSTAGGRIGFQIPGRPATIFFDGAITNGMLAGSVRQGALKGTFSARPGSGAGLVARGIYRAGSSREAVVDDPYGPARLLDLDTGKVRALYPAGAGFAIGSGFATRAPSTGKASFGTTSARIDGSAATRLLVRQLEVRFRSGNVTLAGTLSIPPGAGKHAAVAFVQGSGPTVRSYLPDLSAMLLRNGLGVLVYDKRGIGQSGGVYPGASPTAGAIDTLARDAAAAARFLTGQPEIDDARVGLAGQSQAGWIAPLAAAREPAVRFLALFSGPAVTADENDLYQELAGEGERPPAALSEAAIDAQVLKRGPGGFDPIPSIRRLRIPSLWLYGGKDTFIPPRLSARRLAPIAAEPGRDFTVVEFPNANHALVETKTGLTSEMLRSDTFAPGLFGRVADWLASHKLASPMP